jgi:glycosyltransferase involved in cell wall biosynthesis
MNQSPLVSVIIPAYNSAEWIEECLDSVKKQSYQNIETILVDDGSEDNTSEKAAAFDLNLTLIKQANMGRAKARNVGMEKASGKYIAFLDADDMFTQKSIEKKVEFLEENPDIGWVFTDAVEFDENGNEKLFLDQFPWLDIEKDQFIQLLNKCYPLTSSVMAKSELFKKLGGFDPKLRYAEDLELFMRMSLISNAGMIKEPLTRRRLHQAQAVKSTFNRWDSRVRIYSNFEPQIVSLSEDQQKALTKALSHACFKLGEYYWEIYDFRKSREYFKRSRGNYDWNKRAVQYIALSFLPKFIIKTMRNIKKR